MFGAGEGEAGAGGAAGAAEAGLGLGLGLGLAAAGVEAEEASVACDFEAQVGSYLLHARTHIRAVTHSNTTALSVYPL